MTLEEKKQQYQKILVEEYRSSHPEETEGLTDEEVTLMNPITDADFTFLIGNELNNINKEIKSFSYNDVITKTIKINF